MADIVVTIKDEVLEKVIEAFCATQGYQPTIPNPEPTEDSPTIPNPMSPEEFTRSVIFNIIKDITRQHLIRQAQNQAMINIYAEVEKIII